LSIDEQREQSGKAGGALAGAEERSIPLKLIKNTSVDMSVTVTLLVEGKPYDCADFVRPVPVGTSALEDCGSMALGHIWQLTFTSVTGKDRFFSSGSIVTRGHEAVRGGVPRGRYRVCIHWIPHFVPMSHVTEAFEACGLRVVYEIIDKSIHRLWQARRTFALF
jgi:hypothetical protein